MSNLEKYTKIFTESFEVDAEKAKTLKYQDVEAWDSIGHMDLIASLEDEFDIMMEADDIIDFNSFEKGMEIMTKYGIDMNA